MATTPAPAAAAAAAGEAVMSYGRVGTRRIPPRLGFLSKPSSRWAAISVAPAPRHAAPAAAAAKERVAEEEGPAWVELEPIASEQQLDRALAVAQQLDLPIVLLWMASWCRKCIYLKPKLEKLAAEYHPRIRFYCVDVNAVPQKLVNRAGVTLLESFRVFFPVVLEPGNLSFIGPGNFVKMPSIQLWIDSQKQDEVIGGHKSWLVIDDVRRMIEREE